MSAQKFFYTVLVSALLFIGMFAAPKAKAAAIPAGCPGGPAGTKAAGVDCPKVVCGTIDEATCDKILSTTPTAGNPLGGFSAVIDFFVNFITGLFLAGVVLVIVVSGVQISASAGNPEVIKNAKSNISKAIVGVVLLISARAILSIFGIYSTPGFTPPVTLFQGVDTSSLDSVQKVIANAITIATGIGSIVSVLFVMFGGVRYIIAAGNPESLKSAKSTITYALVGLMISLMAYGIVSFVIERLK